MAYKSENYKPIKRNREFLAQCWEQVQAVPYDVTLRWLFYRMVQEVGLSKKRYKWFGELLSKARVNFWQGWRPWTLVDDTRLATVRGNGSASPSDWIREIREGAEASLDYWRSQPYYVELWFEANAMRGQFEYYTENVTLRPFGGDVSIGQKWRMARAIERSTICGQGVKILYFGDWDEKGESIPIAAVDTLLHWRDTGQCKVEFDYLRVGLNEGDGERYGMPSHPTNPGTYQWEALDDATAGELITGAVGQFVDAGAMARVAELEARVTAKFRAHMEGLRWP